jgi:hypothetical protein
MARLHDRWNARLENWALYRSGVDTVSRAIDDRYHRIRKGDWKIDTSEPPPKPRPLVGDAIDVDRLVKRLDHDHYEAIVLRYCRTFPETLEDRATEAGIHVNTLRYRIDMAIEALDRMQAERDKLTATMLQYVRSSA